MAATDVSICSNALLMLGDKPINDLTENTDRARLAANLYESVRDAILRGHPWNCCITRVSLAPDSTTPAFDWACQYTLPSDFLKALSVGEAGLESEFRIEGRKLLCDDNPALLRYIAKNTNPATWDTCLVDVVTTAMAARMAYPITQSATLAQTLEQTAELTLKRAKSVDGQDDTGEAFGDERLFAARLGGGF
jgi:hypothetical protein